MIKIQHNMQAGESGKVGNVFLKKNVIGKLLIVFGIATLIGTAADYFAILFPLHLRNNQWVYSTVQKCSDSSIIPLLAILLLIIGFYLLNEKENKALLLFERSTATICALFTMFLVVLTLLFSISFSSVENNTISKIKNEGQKAKAQLAYIIEKNPNITPEQTKQIQKNIKKIDKVLIYKVKQIKTSFVITNTKILINLLAYLLAALYFTLSLFKTSALTRKNLIYKHE